MSMGECMELKKLAKTLLELQKLIEHIGHELQKKSSPPSYIASFLKKGRHVLQNIEESVHPELLSRIKSTFARYEKEIGEYTLFWRGRWVDELSTELDQKGKQFVEKQNRFFVPPIRLEVDWQKEKVLYYFGPDAIGRSSMKIRDVLKWIETFFANVKKWSTNPEEFAKLLEKAYAQVAQKKHQTIVPLHDVYREIVLLKQPSKFWTNANIQTFKPYPRYIFSLDIRSLQAWLPNVSHSYEVRLIIATLSSTLQMKNYIWIPYDSGIDGARYSHIELLQTTGKQKPSGS